MIKFIFYIGVIYTVFGLIWGLLTVGYNLLRPQQSEVEKTLFRAISYYFVASMTALNVLHPINDVPITTGEFTFYAIVGGFVLWIYLLSKMQKKQMTAQMKQRLGNLVPPANLKYESYLIAVTLVYYSVSLYYKEILDLKMNNWFFANIRDIYDTFLLKWIFAIIAFFFMINIFVQGGNAIGKIIDQLTGNQGKQRPSVNPFQKQTSDNDFDDFEIIDDEKIQ